MGTLVTGVVLLLLYLTCLGIVIPQWDGEEVMGALVSASTLLFVAAHVGVTKRSAAWCLSWGVFSILSGYHVAPGLVMVLLLVLFRYVEPNPPSLVVNIRLLGEGIATPKSAEMVQLPPQI
jgi:hypothetical protein